MIEKTFKPVFDDIVVAELAPGQRIEMEVFAIKGVGKVILGGTKPPGTLAARENRSSSYLLPYCIIEGARQVVAGSHRLLQTFALD